MQLLVGHDNIVHRGLAVFRNNLTCNDAHHNTLMGVLRYKHLVSLCLALIGMIVFWVLFAPLPVHASDCGAGPTTCIDSPGKRSPACPLR